MAGLVPKVGGVEEEPVACCSTMTDQLAQSCADHDLCPDVVIEQWTDGTLVFPVRDGSSSGVLVIFCPWCGTWCGTGQEPS